jgi:hypothetical protein
MVAREHASRVHQIEEAVLEEKPYWNETEQREQFFRYVYSLAIIGEQRGQILMFISRLNLQCHRPFDNSLLAAIYDSATEKAEEYRAKQKEKIEQIQHYQYLGLDEDKIAQKLSISVLVVRFYQHQPSLKTKKAIHEERAFDIADLVRLRDGHIPQHQHDFLYFYAHFLYLGGKKVREVWELSKALYQQFLHPIQEKEADEAIRLGVIDARRISQDGLGGFMYTNAAIIKKLKITAEEQNHLEEIMSKKEYEFRLLQLQSRGTSTETEHYYEPNR